MPTSSKEIPRHRCSWVKTKKNKTLEKPKPLFRQPGLGENGLCENCLISLLMSKAGAERSDLEDVWERSSDPLD